MTRRAYVAALILPTLLAMSMPIPRNARGGDGADPPGGPCNNDERAISTVSSLYAAFAEGDTDSILKIIHPDVIWIESDGIPYGGRFVGRDAVFEGVFAKIADEWDDFTAEVDEIFSAHGRRVVTLGEDSGRYRATGRSMVARTASFWTLNGHCQVVRFEQYVDTLQVRSAIDIEL